MLLWFWWPVLSNIVEGNQLYHAPFISQTDFSVDTGWLLHITRKYKKPVLDQWGVVADEYMFSILFCRLGVLRHILNGVRNEGRGPAIGTSDNTHGIRILLFSILLSRLCVCLRFWSQGFQTERNAFCEDRSIWQYIYLYPCDFIIKYLKLK